MILLCNSSLSIVLICVRGIEVMGNGIKVRGNDIDMVFTIYSFRVLELTSNCGFILVACSLSSRENY